jgi:uncharacterized protein (DUF433 family)/DNA-binding transcriptional MerR regulator
VPPDQTRPLPRTSASYPAERAAALAGIPRSTLYYWARTALVPPSVSVNKLMRWSYADLLVLRLVDWLRKDKPRGDEERDLPRASMRHIRRELERAEELGERLMDTGFTVEVDPAGRLHFGTVAEKWIELGSGLRQYEAGALDLIRPFEMHLGIIGPDLVRPGETLRIIPGKLSGEPHVEGTRIQTQAIGALEARGLESKSILELYPDLGIENVKAAIGLERRLAENLHEAA